MSVAPFFAANFPELTILEVESLPAPSNSEMYTRPSTTSEPILFDGEPHSLYPPVKDVLMWNLLALLLDLRLNSEQNFPKP